jgi:hypothetical protein
MGQSKRDACRALRRPEISPPRLKDESMPKNDAPCLVHAAYGDASPAGLPISTGVPFRRGVLKKLPTLTAISPTGEERPAAGRVLAKWDDGSIRWLLVSFGARVAGPHEIKWSSAKPAAGVTVRDHKGQWTIETDRIKLVLSETGTGPIAHLECDGHVYLDDPSQLRLVVDDASSLHETARTIRIIEHTALRARIRIEGTHRRASGGRHLSYRLDIEVWNGWPTVRMDYHFFNLEPGADFRPVGRIAIDSNWKLGAATQRHFQQKNYGVFYVSRHVFNPDPVAIVANNVRGTSYVEDAAMLLDDVTYPFYLHAPLVDTSDWLGVGDGEHAVYFTMADFTITKPNRISSAGSGLSAELWPESAGTLDLQQGRSKRQTVLFSFIKQAGKGDKKTEKVSNAPRQAPTGVAAALAAPWHEERACVDPAWLAHCQEFDQHVVLPVGKHVRIESNMASLMQLDMPHSKFDVGDTDSHYAASYSGSGEHLVHPREDAPRISRDWPGAGPTQTYLDCHEPVWTNNEYDVIHAFANEVMRTGKHSLIHTLRLTARHNIEVDFLHYSDHRWLHRATPAHSARHTTTGAYPSHFWTQGLLEYYCLTGDIDALEVAEALGDKTIENFSEPELREVLWGFNREVGWSILALVHLYDITRDKRFKPLLDEIVDYLVAFDRDAYTGAVNLSSGNDRQSLNRQVFGGFFGYQSMLDAVDVYVTATGREDVNQWLIKFCDDLTVACLEAAREGALPDTRFGQLLAIGYERTGDEKYLAFINLLLDQLYWNAQGVRGGASVKPVASIYRGFTRMLGHAMRHGLLDAYEFPSLRKLQQ